MATSKLDLALLCYPLLEGIEVGPVSGLISTADTINTPKAQKCNSFSRWPWRPLGLNY